MLSASFYRHVHVRSQIMIFHCRREYRALLPEIIRDVNQVLNSDIDSIKSNIIIAYYRKHFYKECGVSEVVRPERRQEAINDLR